MVGLDSRWASKRPSVKSFRTEGHRHVWVGAAMNLERGRPKSVAFGAKCLRNGAMSSAELYRAKAAALEAEATQEHAPHRKIELHSLALSYLRLADQAQRNTMMEDTVIAAQRLDGQQSSAG